MQDECCKHCYYELENGQVYFEYFSDLFCSKDCLLSYLSKDKYEEKRFVLKEELFSEDY